MGEPEQAVSVVQRSRRWLAAACVWAACASLTVGLAQTPAPLPYAWDLPDGWPAPRVPAENPMTAAKVALGRHLFYDTRLSTNGTQSCATCHEQRRAFTDGRAQARGSTGQVHPRGSMSLVNIGYASTLTWAHPYMKVLEDQALVPMYGDRPIVELGLRRGENAWLDRLRQVNQYQRLFPEAFGAAPDPFTLDNVTRALASFERSIVSARSLYDRDYDGRDDEATNAARRGETLFFTPPLSCFRCHGGFTLSGPSDWAGRPSGGEGPPFQNTGLYNLAGALSYPPGGLGAYEVTNVPTDVGKFKAPTLRNIAVTAPYMHDGSIATLDGVLDHYAAGGRTIADGPAQGIGRNNPNKSGIVQGFTLSDADRRALLAFLDSLTDEALLKDPRFSDPWPH